MSLKERLGAGLLVLGILQPGLAVASQDEDADAAPRKWEEVAVQEPVFPQEQNLLDFYVSAATDNRFLVDSSSISVGADGVVRYALVIVSGGGTRIVSYEGMRCETRERRSYAFGRADGSWSKSRSQKWWPIVEVTANRHHAALFQEYFCPGGVIVRNSDEAKEALLRGGHPSVKRW